MAGPLREAVDAAVAEMHWITGADQAAIRLAQAYADRMDEAIEYAEGQELTKALYLGPHLLRALASLGGTPEGRGVLDVRQEVKGKLAVLRERRGA